MLICPNSRNILLWKGNILNSSQSSFMSRELFFFILDLSWHLWSNFGKERARAY